MTMYPTEHEEYAWEIQRLKAAHDALQAQLAEAQAERDHERLRYEGMVSDRDDWRERAQDAQAAMATARADRDAWQAKAERLGIEGRDAAIALAEARAEVERLGSTLTGATQHSQDVTRQWMDERVRAIAAEAAAAHWQAEHGRCEKELADLRKGMVK